MLLSCRDRQSLEPWYRVQRALRGLEHALQSALTLRRWLNIVCLALLRPDRKKLPRNRRRVIKGPSPTARDIRKAIAGRAFGGQTARGRLDEFPGALGSPLLLESSPH